MSLTLLQGYSSPEEDQEEGLQSSEEEEQEDASSLIHDQRNPAPVKKSRKFSEASNFPHGVENLPSSSSLPSALDAFSKISGPPEFLNNTVGKISEESNDPSKETAGRGHPNRNLRREKDGKDGIIVEAKPQLVAIRDRVRSDLDGGNASSAQTNGGSSNKIKTAANPGREDAAELLRMCVQCGVPKTFTHNRGMICPICGDRPPAEPGLTRDRKGSVIKDKEKSKRMKGQSSHATWKSETEMQLRQQFD